MGILEGTKRFMKVKVKSLSPVRLFATPWTGAHQAPPSMGFSRQEYWSGVPFPVKATAYFIVFQKLTLQNIFPIHVVEA